MYNLQDSRFLFTKIKEKYIDDRNQRYVEEFIKSVCELNAMYDVRIFENRFIIGGTVEYLFTALLNALGFYTKNQGHISFGVDISVAYDGVESEFSMKYSTGTNNIILINSAATSLRDWVEPTIFIIQNYKIFYADPELMEAAIGSNYLSKKSANLTLPFSSIKKYLSTSIGEKYSMDYSSRCIGIYTEKRVVSYDVASGILHDKSLKRYLNKPYQKVAAQLYPYEEDRNVVSDVIIDRKKKLKSYTPFIYPFSL